MVQGRVMSEIDFSHKSGHKVLIVGEVLKSRMKAETADGAKLDYYVVRVEGNDNPIVVASSSVRAYEVTRHRLRDKDLDESRSSMARNIRSFRKAANMSQQDVGRALGVKQATVSAWEMGTASPRAYMLLPLCRLLKISLEDLYEDD